MIRRLQSLLRELSLTQQLLVIIMMSAVVIVMLFFVYLRGNIEKVVTEQTYSLLNRSQREVIQIYNEGVMDLDEFANIQESIAHMFITEGQFVSKVGDYLDGEPLMKIYLDEIAPLGINRNGVVRINGHRVFYRIQIIDQDTIVISFIDEAYGKTLEASLFNSVSNISALVVGILFVLLVAWVSSLIHPLNQIRTYIEKIRNGENVTLNIDRNDEIGEVAFALVNMREELKKQDEIKEEMIHNISHDLKTPIATIKSYGESIKDGVYPYETLEKSVDVIVDNADRLERKVHSLLFLNRLDYLLSSNEREIEEIQMKEIVDIVLLSLIVIRPEIEMTVNLEPVIFRGNEESWRILVENLMDNALRYAKKNITVTLKEGYFAVFNDGAPISADRMDKMFKPFEKGSGGKFGLGLSICSKVVAAYGYTIEAQNMEDGVIFRVRDKTPVKKEKIMNTIKIPTQKKKEKKDKKK